MINPYIIFLLGQTYPLKTTWDLIKISKQFKEEAYDLFQEDYLNVYAKALVKSARQIDEFILWRHKCKTQWKN